eukprot:1811659-Pleurochrysis_carterae.AAC.1
MLLPTTGVALLGRLIAVTTELTARFARSDKVGRPKVEVNLKSSSTADAASPLGSASAFVAVTLSVPASSAYGVYAGVELVVLLTPGGLGGLSIPSRGSTRT